MQRSRITVPCLESINQSVECNGMPLLAVMSYRLDRRGCNAGHCLEEQVEPIENIPVGKAALQTTTTTEQELFFHSSSVDRLYLSQLHCSAH